MEIARRVGLASSALFQRIKELEKLGIIQGFTTRLNAKALGYGLFAFVQVRTASGARAPEVTRALVAIPEVLRFIGWSERTDSIPRYL